MSQFEPPPTYADPVIVNESTGKQQFNPIWLKWFVDIASFISASGGGGGTAPVHNSLSGLQGGGTGEYYHFTAAEHTQGLALITALGGISGYTGTVTLAKLTSTGANGSFSVQNGLITSVTPPT